MLTLKRATWCRVSPSDIRGDAAAPPGLPSLAKIVDRLLFAGFKLIGREACGREHLRPISSDH